MNKYKKLKKDYKLLQGTWQFEAVFLFLAVFSISLYIYELSTELPRAVINIFDGIDTVIAFMFLTEFLMGVVASEKRFKYFLHNWPDLLASVPLTFGVFRALRAFRIFRLLRMIRLISRMRRLVLITQKLAIIAGTILLTGAVMFYSFEVNVNNNVNSFFDAIWWAIVTTTSVGYGDIYPITWEGRMVSIALMLTGLGLIGLVATYVGDYLVKVKKDNN